MPRAERIAIAICESNGFYYVLENRLTGARRTIWVKYVERTDRPRKPRSTT